MPGFNTSAKIPVMVDDPASLAEATQVPFLVGSLKPQLESEVNAEFRRLLEGRHLYQSFKIEHRGRVPSGVSGANTTQIEDQLDKYLEAPWIIEPAQLPGGPPLRRIVDTPDAPHVTVDTVKLFCSRCERVEPYNLVSTGELYAGLDKRGVRVTRRGTHQMIVLLYQCQACKESPEVFLLSRFGKKVTLVGRAPMEVANVPDVIPKSHQKFFSDAIVAYQSGQILPALFMLRTFVEQFAASAVNATSAERADEILDRYMASLHDAVRAHFPSLRDVYSRLSAAIHAARADVGLFDRSFAEIVRHFEARRLYSAA